ncbi:hypothetical protein F01_410430 [Burkholderia cenocepacia]|nr:hypothetical protein F01_410430 [Burkholderia cenocepacia]
MIPGVAFAPGVPKIVNTRGNFPTDEAATKLIWLALWSSATHDWKGLSGILCLRHNMLPRRIYASQTESPAGGSAGDSGRVA